MRTANETHLIGENAVHAIVIKMDHPVQPLDLVWTHLTSLDAAGLLLETVRDTANRDNSNVKMDFILRIKPIRIRCIGETKRVRFFEPRVPHSIGKRNIQTRMLGRARLSVI